jgi:hypothetical protein
MQLKRKRVFLKNGGSTPAPWSIKLHHDWFIVFDAYLIDAIFVAVQGQQSAIAQHARHFSGGHDEFRRQLIEGM